MEQPNFESMEEFVRYMEDNGYWAKDGTPIKCEHCESVEGFNKTNVYTENFFEVEYTAVCESCGKTIGHWSYGNWQV